MSKNYETVYTIVYLDSETVWPEKARQPAFYSPLDGDKLNYISFFLALVHTSTLMAVSMEVTFFNG